MKLGYHHRGPCHRPPVCPRKRPGCKAVMLIIYNRGARELGQGVEEGHSFKNVSKLDDGRNKIDDSNTGVGGLKADK